MGSKPSAVEITPEIVREMERGLKCSIRERERLIRVLRMFKVPVKPNIEKELVKMDQYLSEWYTLIILEVTETFTIEEEETELCSNCKPARSKKKVKKGGKVPPPARTVRSSPSSSAGPSQSSTASSSGSGKSSTYFLSN